MSEMVSPRYHPLLAWLILVLLLCVVVLFGIIPAVLKSHALSEQIERGYSRLVKMRQAALAAPQIMADYERVRQQGLDKLFYPQGMTSAQVAKELQNRLGEVVQRHQGLMLSSEVVELDTNKEERITEYQQVTVQATFQGSMTLLREVLHEAYSARPLIFVEALEVRPVTGQEEQLAKATVKVSTYWRGGV